MTDLSAIGRSVTDRSAVDRLQVWFLGAILQQRGIRAKAESQTSQEMDRQAPTHSGGRKERPIRQRLGNLRGAVWRKGPE